MKTIILFVALVLSACVPVPAQVAISPTGVNFTPSANNLLEVSFAPAVDGNYPWQMAGYYSLSGLNSDMNLWLSNSVLNEGSAYVISRSSGPHSAPTDILPGYFIGAYIFRSHHNGSWYHDAWISSTLTSSGPMLSIGVGNQSYPPPARLNITSDGLVVANGVIQSNSGFNCYGTQGVNGNTSFADHDGHVNAIQVRGGIITSWSVDGVQISLP